MKTSLNILIALVVLAAGVSWRICPHRTSSEAAAPDVVEKSECCSTTAPTTPVAKAKPAEDPDDCACGGPARCRCIEAVQIRCDLLGDPVAQVDLCVYRGEPLPASWATRSDAPNPPPPKWM